MITTCAIAMICCEGWGLGDGRYKPKKSKIKGCGTTFLSLGRCLGDAEEGVQLNQIVEKLNL